MNTYYIGMSARLAASTHAAKQVVMSPKLRRFFAVDCGVNAFIYTTYLHHLDYG